MAKSSSPIRLENELMKQAKLSGELNKRSVAEQIEYWAEIGRGVAGVIDPEMLIKVNSGLAKINIEETQHSHIDADDIFGNLEQQRESGALSRNITTSHFAFQASKSAEGMLERVDPLGNITLGYFENGEFVEARG
jgi:ParD-like antitoxin of type II bacterial toxin-antitoxin system